MNTQKQILENYVSQLQRPETRAVVSSILSQKGLALSSGGTLAKMRPQT